MGRMSSLHKPTNLGGGLSIAPASRNGDTTNVVNGSTIDLHGKRGVVFIGSIGALTGSANVAAHLQVNDLHLDPANGNWTNVNSTTYPNAAQAASTDNDSVYELSYEPAAGGSPIVRVVQTVDANAAISGISHFTF